MLMGEVYERFANGTPVCVATRAVLEWALAPEALDQLFRDTAVAQYERELLFSTCVDLLAGVVCRIHRSPHAADQAATPALNVSVQSLYDKLAHLEPATAAALVRHTAGRLRSLLRDLGAERPPTIPGYQLKILDGNHLTRTERRLGLLRDVAAGPLPGQTLVVLEPELGLATDVVCGEDGHAQERRLLGPILDGVQAGDLWVADRNFCTTGFLFGLAARHGKFAIRQHGSTLTWEREGELRPAGSCAAGRLFERELWLQDGQGGTLKVRQVTLVLHQPTRDGETEIRVLTNLPAAVRATRVLAVYRERWTIEGLFQELTTILRCEVNTLGYPKAALFGFCVALAASNVLAAVRAGLRAAHGAAAADEHLSTYYLADELSGLYRGLMVALPAATWAPVQAWSSPELARWLKALLKRARLARFQKHPRGPKKPRQRRTRFTREKHISTAKLLALEKGYKSDP